MQRRPVPSTQGLGSAPHQRIKDPLISTPSPFPPVLFLSTPELHSHSFVCAVVPRSSVDTTHVWSRGHWGVTVKQFAFF